MLIVEYYHNNIMLIKVIIPCHLDSLRLKRKVLINIEGLPMIEHVRRRVLLAEEIGEVLIATGDSEIKDIVESYGGKVVFTNNIHQNGTSRVFEAISKSTGKGLNALEIMTSVFKFFSSKIFF